MSSPSSAAGSQSELPGCCLWFTGLSGAGKSTIANLVVAQLRERGRRVELCEELIGRGLPFALAAPRHPSATVIADQRQVPVSLAPRDLIQRDLEEIVETVGGQQLVADPLDDPPDGLPVDPHQPAGRGPIGLGQKPGDKVFEVAREAGAVAGERHALDQRPMLGTTQPSEPRVNLQPPDPQVQVPPDRVVVLLTLPMRSRVGALRATKTAALEPDRDHNPVRVKAAPRRSEWVVDLSGGDGHVS